MITVSALSADLATLDVDVIAVGVFKGGIEAPGTTQVLSLLGLEDFPVTPAFRGDVGQTLRLAAPGQPFKSVVLVGLGRMDGVTAPLLRRAAGDVVRAAPKAGRIATTLAEVHPTRAAVEAVADGLRLGCYLDGRYKGRDAQAALDRELLLVVPSSLMVEAQAAIERSTVVCDAVEFARDLVNTPPGEARPQDVAEAVAARLSGAGFATVSVTVHDEAWLAQQGCGAILGVGRGSAAPPRLVELSYVPESPLAHVVLVGKGITFDTGGLNLKTNASMMTMKCDMAGAAAVAAAVEGAARLGVRVQVTGLMALAENAIGGDAQRPSDIVTAFDGTTIEVQHTDAEGRLVLADALAYGASMQPDAMIDLATLTGSAVVALGPYTAALLSDDDPLVEGILAAGEAAGEQLWRLPLLADLDTRLDSRIADVDHLGPDHGPDAVMGALFLRRFTGEVPWAHVDMAGPAWFNAADARGHQPVGATGYGVSTLLAYLQHHGG